MIDFMMRVAGHSAAITTMYESTRRFCEAFLCEAEPDFSVQITEADIRFEREKSRRENLLEGKAKREFSDMYLETIAVQRKLAEHLYGFDTLMFHGSVVAVDGVGYLFTARSGTGKSTHTRLWREVFGSRAVMINDDKPFLQIGSGQVIAHGSPWNGKHGPGCSRCAPLRAICILQRGEENRIRPIPAAEALPMLIQQSQRPGDRSNYPRYMTCWADLQIAWHSTGLRATWIPLRRLLRMKEWSRMNHEWPWRMRPLKRTFGRKGNRR